MEKIKEKIAIIGSGNIGKAIAKGLLESKVIAPSKLTLTRRNTDSLNEFADKGVKVTSNNIIAAKFFNNYTCRNSTKNGWSSSRN